MKPQKFVDQKSLRKFLFVLLSGEGIPNASYNALYEFLENFDPYWYGDIITLIYKENGRSFLKDNDIDLLRSFDTP